MTSFYTKDGELFASNVQVKRIARELCKLSGTPTMNEALNLAAQLLGARNEYDMRQRAADPDISRLSNEQVNRLLQDSACHSGKKFPKGLPTKFAEGWQRKAQQLFAQAVNAREPGQLEFIALVGGEGAGKTLLANHMCKQFGGYVVDAELFDPYAPFNIPGYHKRIHHKPGEVMIYDRPTKAATARSNEVFFKLLQGQIGPEYRSLSNYREKARCFKPLIPGEEAGHFGSNARDWVLSHRDTTMVICFATREQVEEAMSLKCGARIGSPFKGSYDWRRAHVVDLDSMTHYSVDGPGATKEKLVPA